MDPIQGVFLLHIQCSWDRLRIRKKFALYVKSKLHTSNASHLGSLLIFKGNNCINLSNWFVKFDVFFLTNPLMRKIWLRNKSFQLSDKQLRTLESNFLSYLSCTHHLSRSGFCSSWENAMSEKKPWSLLACVM